MADSVGNVLRPPSTSVKAASTDDEILASYGGLTQKGLTILSGAGALQTGTVLKLSGTAKKYTAAVKADTGTANRCVGILRKDVDATSQDMLANVVLSGRIKGAKVKYSDDTDGLTTTELQTLATAMGGRYDTIHDILFF